MDPDFESLAKERAKSLGFSTFSAYVNQLIRADLITRGAMMVAEQSGSRNQLTQNFSSASDAPAPKPLKYPKAGKPRKKKG